MLLSTRMHIRIMGRGEEENEVIEMPSMCIMNVI
jgi:hypothetical protein